MFDFDQFNDEFEPVDPFSGNKVDDLEDGDYEFQIKAAKFKEAKGNAIFEWKLEVLTPGKHHGQEINFPHFMKNKDVDSAKRYGAVLKKLGFDTELWKAQFGRTFGEEIHKSTRWLVGMKFKARKSTSKVAPKFANDTEKIYHNLTIKSRCEGDGVPMKIGPEQLNQADPQAEDDPFAESA